MPIYEYQCGACGQVQEFLQKLSEPPRTRCEHCGKDALAKRVTAAGFQLKGSGWYVTDFRNGGSKPSSGDKASGDKASGDKSPGGKAADGGGASASPAAAAPAAPAGSPTPSAGASPASGS